MRSLVFIYLCISLLPSLAMAGAFEVAPTTITLPAGARFAALYVTNRGKQTVSAQIEAFDWQQADGSDHLTPSEGLIVSPPMVKLLPGQKQTVRLAVDPDATNAKERSFRLVVSELPDPSAKPSDAVQVLLQFSVPVFVVAAEKKPLALIWNITQSPKGLLLTAQNSGNRHVKISELTLTSPSDKDITVAPNTFNYILPGMSHSWNVDLHGSTPGPGDTFRIKTKDESDGIINSSILIPR